MGERHIVLAGTVLAGTLAAVALFGQGSETSAAAPAAPAEPAYVRDFSMRPTVDPAEAMQGEIPRRVLALYDSTETVEQEGSGRPRPMDEEVAPAHTLAELPLNHLGLAVDYHDVNAPQFPSDEEMTRYAGIIAWFQDDRLADPGRYARWIESQLSSGRRVVFVERFGALRTLDGEPTAPELLEPLWRATGIRYTGHGTRDSSVISLVEAETPLVGFERPLPARLPAYDGITAPGDAEVLLRVERTDIESSASDAVFVSPRGGFALAGYAVTEDRLGERWVRRWLIDPFRFFESALGLRGVPRLDFTTLNGRRMFYAHIDGDGMEMLSELDYSTRCGDVVREHILERYPLPFTASVVVGMTAPPPIGRGTPDDVEVARRIFALDNVEVGSHGLAHPMNWRGGSDAELSVPDLPGYELSAEAEVAQSVAYIDAHLAPPDKPTRIMLWTGWTNPSREQLAVAYRLGLRNLNGGDPRMDEHYPSYAHLAPPRHPVGDLFQYYTSAANDFILTDDWTPPYYRFQNVVQSFERSGTPRRIVPLNIYIHFYIARNQAGLTGLTRALEWVMDHDIAPVFASDYVDVVRDFQWGRIARSGDGAFEVRTGPALRTVRFDDPSIHIDMEASSGVLGYLQVPELNATYVHLAGQRATIVPANRAPAVPHLRQASHPVEGARFDGDQVSFRTRGVGPRSFVLAGMEPGSAVVAEASAGERTATARAEVGVDGVVRIELPSLGISDAMVTVRGGAR